MIWEGMSRFLDPLRRWAFLPRNTFRDTFVSNSSRTRLERAASLRSLVSVARTSSLHARNVEASAILCGKKSTKNCLKLKSKEASSEVEYASAEESDSLHCTVSTALRICLRARAIHGICLSLLCRRSSKCKTYRTQRERRCRGFERLPSGDRYPKRSSPY
jgi:hypothetical protein